MNIPSQNLEELKKTIEVWRKTRTRKDKLPEELWQEAILASKVRGVGAVAKFLGLDFYQLRDRVRQHESVPVEKSPKGAERAQNQTITVSKIIAPVAGDLSPLLEFENAQGVKLRIEAHSEFASKLLGAFFGSMR